MIRSIAFSTLLGAACAGIAFAQQQPKVPVLSNDEGSIYVQPNVYSDDKATTTRGATFGLQQKDGSSAYGGIDTGGARPTYSVGGSTGGIISYSAGAHSDGSKNQGVKAGVTIRY